MTLIEDLKNKLTNPTLSNEELNSLIEAKKNYISQRTGMPLTPKTVTDYCKDFKGSEFVLSSYPVKEIILIKENSILCTDNYVLNKDAGILYFTEYKEGFLIVEYTVCLPEDILNNYANPLILDLIVYDLNDSFTKNATEVKEGDVSVTLGIDGSSWDSLELRINELKSLFGARVSLI